jgi:hypothetical protein
VGPKTPKPQNPLKVDEYRNNLKLRNKILIIWIN